MKCRVSFNPPTCPPESVPLKHKSCTNRLFFGIAWYGFLEYYHPNDADELKSQCLDSARDAIKKISQTQLEILNEQNAFKKKELIEENMIETIRMCMAVIRLRSPIQPINLATAFDEDITEEVIGTTFHFSVQPRHNTNIDDIIKIRQTIKEGLRKFQWAFSDNEEWGNAELSLELDGFSKLYRRDTDKIFDALTDELDRLANKLPSDISASLKKISLP